MVVDLAGETGGNCELTEPGQTVVKHGVTIASPLNLPATMPEHASELYSKNLTSLLELLIKDGALAPDFDDEVVSASCVTREVQNDVHPTAGQSGDPGARRVRRIRRDLQGAQHVAHPLMSGTNAIHGIVVLGALLVLGNLPADANWGVRIIAFVALVFGTLNVIGGFLVTDRMLGMFKGKKKELPAAQGAPSTMRSSPVTHLVDVLYIFAFASSSTA